MCKALLGLQPPKMASIAAPILSAQSDAGRRQGDLEARLRRARAGAAADILTTPEGLSGAAMTFGGA